MAVMMAMYNQERTSGVSHDHKAEPSAGAHWRRSDVAFQGSRLAVFEAGPPETETPPIVLVHGLGHWTQAAWDRVAALLEPSCRIVAFDLPGFGESGKPDARYPTSFFVSAIRTVVEARDASGCVLAGHSLGGLAAASYASHYADELTQLTLIDPAGFLRTPGLLLRIVASKPVSSLFQIKPTRGFVRSQLYRSVYDRNALSESTIEHAYRLAEDPQMRRAFARVYSDALREFLDLPALHAGLARYTGPASILWGREDLYVPIAALENARAVYPQADVTVLERCGHCPNIEYPAVIANKLAAATSLPSSRRRPHLQT
jgi:pimeloyl-ACP methyl ester carboxylesterase